MAINMPRSTEIIDTVKATRQSSELTADLLQVIHKPGRGAVLAFG